MLEYLTNTCVHTAVLRFSSRLWGGSWLCNSSVGTCLPASLFCKSKGEIFKFSCAYVKLKCLELNGVLLAIKIYYFLKILFIYLFMRNTQREAETQAEGEAGSMQGADMGLHPGSPGSRPGPNAALNHWATQAARWLLS